MIQEAGKKVLTEMVFSLIPAWSKERRVKFATHNARLISEEEKPHHEIPIYQKPTWREPFAKRHCLVPMTKFIEPIYTGPLAGNMVRFFPREGQVFVAAGIWEEWVDKNTGEVVPSFSILTDDPAPYIAKMGHDRTPVFLGQAHFDEWLNAPSKKPAEWIKFLRANTEEISWTEEIDRALVPGWKNRIDPV